MSFHFRFQSFLSFVSLLCFLFLKLPIHSPDLVLEFRFAHGAGPPTCQGTVQDDYFSRSVPVSLENRKETVREGRECVQCQLTAGHDMRRNGDVKTNF